MLLQDSVHGRFSGSLEINEKEHSITVNGQNIKFLNSNEKINFKNHGIKNSILIDSTGIYKDRESLS